jgi:hypothetical protein
MNQFASVALAGALCLSTISPVLSAQPPQIPTTAPTPLGFSTLVCVADALVGAALPSGEPIVLFGGQVKIESVSDIYSANDILAIDVKIAHGKKSSQHTITFTDDGLSPNTLNCGHAIVAIF